MIRNRRTRIVATLGPVSRDADSVLELAKTGVDVFRLNFSHGSYDDHQLAFDNVRAAEPVSYTHLDVYKRQMLELALFTERQIQIK